MEEKKMILVTDGYDDKPICVASNTIAARESALDYLENQYDDGEWEAILEEDGYENRDDLFHAGSQRLGEKCRNGNYSYA